MSKIFLPTGGTIEIHNGWTSSINANGSALYYSKDKEPVYLGEITSSGIVHLTNSCRYTYYPPPLTNLDETYVAIKDNIKQLRGGQLIVLKRLLAEFNAKRCEWK